MKFADPKNDIAFKKIFGDENKTEVLISFLNSILDFKDTKQIKSITLANSYQIPKIEELKNTILDIKAINQDDEEFIVEMQVEKDKNFAKRCLYYTSKSYVNQINKAEEYHKLKKVYFVGILDFAIFETNDYLSSHLILDKKTQKQEINDFEFNFIELAKFNLELSECDTIAKKWIYFIQNAENLEMIPKELEVIEEFKTAFETAKIYNWNKEELNVYDYVSMQVGKKLNEIETARQDGEKKKQIEIAKNLMKAGIDKKIIITTTGLSLQEVQNLINLSDYENSPK